MTEADLIEEVRGYPLLWDPKIKDYKDKHQRELVWTKIQQKFEFSAKDTWTRLRQSHAKALARQKKPPSGSGAMKTWKHMEAMSFLLPSKEPRNTVTNCPERNEGDDLDDDGFDNANEEGSLEKEDALHADTTLEESGTEVIDPTPPPTPKAASTSHKKRKRSDSPDATALSISEAAKSITKRFSAPQPVESHRMGFFRSILPEVEKLSISDFITFQMGVLKSLSQVTEKTSPPQQYQRQLNYPPAAASRIRSYPPSEYDREYDTSDTYSTPSSAGSPRFQFL